MNINLVCNYVQPHSPHETLYYLKPCVTKLGSVIICGQCNYKFYRDNTKKLLD